MSQSVLGENLGLRPGERAVIFCGDLLGFCNATNLATYTSLRSGVLNSARIMVPAPWVRGAIQRYRGEDVGVNLVLNSEHPIFHFGPVTFSPTLLDGSGGFPATLGDLWDHADLDEVRREARTQIERSIIWGFDVSHLSSHLGALFERPEFFDVLLDLALEFQLPLRVPASFTEDSLGFPLRQIARDEGAILTDDAIDLFHLCVKQSSDPTETAERILDRLQPGVTEVTLRTGQDTPELRGLMEDWPSYIANYSFALAMPEVMGVLNKAKVKLFAYRALRDVSRGIRR